MVSVRGGPAGIVYLEGFTTGVSIQREGIEDDDGDAYLSVVKDGLLMFLHQYFI